MAIIIRDAQSQDVETLASLLADLFSLEQDFTVNAERQRTGLSLLMDSGAAVLCAKSDGRVVGMATMQEIISTSMGGLSGLVEDVVIDKEFRRRGIGRRLLAALEEKARSLGYARIQLVADDGNSAAHRFYESQGWNRTNLRAWHRIL